MDQARFSRQLGRWILVVLAWSQGCAWTGRPSPSSFVARQALLFLQCHAGGCSCTGSTTVPRLHSRGGGGSVGSWRQLNKNRRLEARLRKLGGDMQQKHAQWVKFQKELQQTFHQERKTYLADVSALERELVDARKAKDAAMEQLLDLTDKSKKSLGDGNKPRDASLTEQLTSEDRQAWDSLVSGPAEMEQDQDFNDEDLRNALMVTKDPQAFAEAFTHLRCLPSLRMWRPKPASPPHSHTQRDKPLRLLQILICGLPDRPMRMCTMPCFPLQKRWPKRAYPRSLGVPLSARAVAGLR